MEKLYLALVDTPGFFASVIRRVIGIDYIHVVLSMDEELNEAYSVGRRNPAVPILAGFEKEDAQKIEQVFPTAKYKVMSIECTKEQKENISSSCRNVFPKDFIIIIVSLGFPCYYVIYLFTRGTTIHVLPLWQTFWKKWDGAFWKAFFTGDTKGFL